MSQPDLFAFDEQDPRAPKPKRVGGARAWLASLAVLVVIGLAYVGAYVSWGASLPPGTEVQGVDLSGLSREDAVDVLESELAAQSAEGIEIRVVTESTVIDPTEAGLSVDFEASVDRVGRPSLNPVQIFQNRFGSGRSADLVVVVDDAALAATVDGLAEEYDRKAVDGAITFEGGQVVERDAVEGWRVQADETTDALIDAYMFADEPVEAVVKTRKPTVTQRDVRVAVREFAGPAMSAPVTVRNDAGTAVLSQAVIGSALTVEPDDEGELVPELDGEALVANAGAELDPLRQQASDARVRLEGGRPVVVPASKGISFDDDDLAAAVMPVLTEKGKKRAAIVESAVVKPGYTTAEARDSGVKEVVSEFTTYYPHSSDSYRNVNIGRAAELLNNSFLQPGEVLSFNQTVGERTPERGFVEGGVIVNDRYGTSYGGGISQLVTTTFNAAHFAGFRDVEHHPHTLYISRYPMGREATVSWGSWDLQFENNTPHGAVIQAFISPSSPSSQGAVTVRVWSTEYWNVRSTTGDPYNFTQPETRRVDADDCAPTSPSQGFDVDVRRVVSRGNSVAIDETLFTRYDPVDEIVCVG